MKFTSVLIGVTCVMVLNCLAADKDKYYLIKEEKESTYKTVEEYGFHNVNKWAKDSQTSGIFSDAFDVEADYIVKNTHRRLTIKGNTDAAFQGGRIVLGEYGAHGAMLLYTPSPYVVNFANKGVLLVHGCILCAGSSVNYITDGTIAVDTYKSGYTHISFNKNKNSLTHKGALSVAESALLVVGGDNAFGGAAVQATLKLTKENSCENVAGTVKVASVVNTESGTKTLFPDTTFAVATTVFPGVLEVDVNCRLALVAGGDKLTIDTLRFAENTYLEIPYDPATGSFGCVEVTNSMSVSSVLKVQMPLVISSVAKVPVLKYPADSNISADAFQLDGSPYDPFRVLTVEQEDDICVVYVSYKNQPVYQQTISQELGADTWSDGESVHPGANYWLDLDHVTESGASAVTLNIPTGSMSYVFQGDSLTIGKDGKLRGYRESSSSSALGQEFSCKVLRMLNGSRISMRPKVPITITGGVLYAVDGEVYLAAGNERRFVINSKIAGNADLLLAGYLEGGSGTPDACYEFMAENDEFMGKIIVRQSKVDSYPENGITKYRNDYNSRYNRLKISGASSLGGNLPSFEPKALTLSRYAQLIVGVDTVLSERSNRGIFIEDTGRIKVEQDYTFRMETPLAINGTFWKEGAGTLDLAGRAAFGSTGLAEKPTANKDNFIVTGGVVRVSNAYAVDGCKMLFHKDTALELAMDLEDEELMAQGIRNVKTDTPFVLGEGVDKLPVSMVFDADATPPSTDFTVALLTVSGNAAAGVKAMLPTAVKFPFKSYMSTLVETTDENTGYVTFGYRLKYQAMKIIIR